MKLTEKQNAELFELVKKYAESIKELGKDKVILAITGEKL